MDKVVDHLLVFKGEGEIKDFPGNYTQYREWSKMQSKDSDDNSTKPTKKNKSYRDESTQRRRMSYKEKMEFAQLDKDINDLTNEKHSIEQELSSGTISVERITELSKRLPLLNEELDAKEMRWLELSEIE